MTGGREGGMKEERPTGGKNPDVELSRPGRRESMFSGIDSHTSRNPSSLFRSKEVFTGDRSTSKRERKRRKRKRKKRNSSNPKGETSETRRVSTQQLRIEYGGFDCLAFLAFLIIS